VNKPTFYEQVGIVIPGAVFLVGVLFYFPALNTLLAKDGVTLGQFGIFLLLSYAAGHLIAAVGNLLENVLWQPFGGMPTDWVTQTGDISLLSSQQRDAVEAKVRTRFGIAVDKLRGIERKAWFPISRQIYADVNKNGKPDRIDTFNGNYGLNRGLSAACITLACVAATRSDWSVALGLVVLAVIFAYRAYRFGVHYGREMYLQFLVLTDAEAKKPSGEKAGQET
jgi:hypothetical protein